MYSGLDSKRVCFGGGFAWLAEVLLVWGKGATAWRAGLFKGGGGGLGCAGARRASISLSGQNFYPWPRRVRAGGVVDFLAGGR